MFFKNSKEKHKKIKICIIFICILIIVIGLINLYINDYYHADIKSIESFSNNNTTVKMSKISDDIMIFEPEEYNTGMIFYPGGKVEYTSYIPLMQEFASQGVFGVLINMPLNLAVLDINAADGIQQQYPNIEKWYIGGHSLGGAMAAKYLSEHEDKFEGLVLMGSYSTENYSDTDLKIISIYGSEDKVMNYDKYEKYKANLPSDFLEIIIDGGCHSYFGMYGKQDGDGIPTITNEDQIIKTVETVTYWMKNE